MAIRLTEPAMIVTEYPTGFVVRNERIAEQLRAAGARFVDVDEGVAATDKAEQ